MNSSQKNGNRGARFYLRGVVHSETDGLNCKYRLQYHFQRWALSPGGRMKTEIVMWRLIRKLEGLYRRRRKAPEQRPFFIRITLTYVYTCIYIYIYIYNADISSLLNATNSKDFQRSKRLEWAGHEWRAEGGLIRQVLLNRPVGRSRQRRMDRLKWRLEVIT